MSLNSSFLKTKLPAFAKAHPEIEFSVSPKPGKHPVVIGHYINGREKAICVRKMQAEEIQQKVELLRDASGEKSKKYKRAVSSINPSVRGVWSPYHGNGMPV
jgi:large subunit ribosomal protein L43